MFKMNKLARRGLLSIITLSALYPVSDTRASYWESDWQYEDDWKTPAIADIPDYTLAPLNPDDEIQPKADFSSPLEPLFEEEDTWQKIVHQNLFEEVPQDPRVQMTELAEDIQARIAKEDEEKAKREAEEADAVDRNNARLALMILNKKEPGSVQEVSTFLRRLVEQDNNPYAAFMLAQLYGSGKIVYVPEPMPAEPVKKKGRGRKKKAAEVIPQVTPQQQYAFNQTMACRYFEIADAYGHPDAKYHLAGMWSSGANGVVDLQKAFDFLCAAATKGHLDSTHALGLWYRHQAIQTKEPKAAEVVYSTSWSYFWQAAQSNHLPSILELAHIYRHGQGAHQDHEMAFRYYLQVIEQGRDELRQLVDFIYVTEQAPSMPLPLQERAYALGLINFNALFGVPNGVPSLPELDVPADDEKEGAPLLQETPSCEDDFKEGQEPVNPLKRSDPESDAAEAFPNSASNSSLTEGVELSRPEPVAPTVTKVSKSDAIESYKGPRQFAPSKKKAASGTKRAKKK